MKTIFFVLVVHTFIILIASDIAQAFTVKAFSDDNKMVLKPKHWQEVDMSYWVKIYGKSYQNTIQLLRPKTYLAQHHITHVGQKIILTLSDIGLFHQLVTITTIKKIVTAFKNCKAKHCYRVIGLFKHYATNVKTYRFKNLTTKKIFIINGTPNHLFYVKNKHQFLPISKVSSKDQLVGKHNQIIKLLCNPHQFNHCGTNSKDQKNMNQPVAVYNLEVYPRHNYRVGTDAMIVHNAPCSDTDLEAARIAKENEIREEARARETSILRRESEIRNFNWMDMNSLPNGTRFDSELPPYDYRRPELPAYQLEDLDHINSGARFESSPQSRPAFLCSEQIREIPPPYIEDFNPATSMNTSRFMRFHPLEGGAYTSHEYIHHINPWMISRWTIMKKLLCSKEILFALAPVGVGTATVILLKKYQKGLISLD